MKRKIHALATTYSLGRAVDADPTLSYIIMKRRSSGDGHIAVYFVDATAKNLQVLHVFHTKQDWQTKL